MPTWKHLRGIFRALQLSNDDGLYAQWFGFDNRWELRGSPSNSVLRRFKHAASLAAAKVGKGGTVEAFLEVLKLQEHTYRETGSFTTLIAKNKLGEYPIGSILRVCEAAADYCEKQIPNDEIRSRLLRTLEQLRHDEKTAEPIDQQIAGSLNPPKKPTIGQQIENLRLECGWTAEEVAERINITPRSVYRHLSDEDRPSKLNLAKYARVFTQHLERTVVIDGTSVNVTKLQKKT